MLGESHAFSSFSTDNVAAAREFYGTVLGLTVEESHEMGPMLTLRFPHGASTLIYQKDDHEPASHTVLMFPVEHVEHVAHELVRRGVMLEQLEWTDQDGIARGPGPRMAWLRDPAGNWLQLIEGQGP